MDTVRKQFGILQVGIVALALSTAAIHFVLFLGNPGMLVMFLFNALGYSGLLAAYYLPLPFLADKKRLVRYAFIGYTLVTILAWVFMGDRGPVGWIDKAIEVALVALLFSERP